MGIFSKYVEELFRPFSSKSGGLFQKPEPPALPPVKPISPLATKISGKGDDERQRRLRRGVSGRKDTIVTGELSPKKVGKTSLLGRTSRG